MNKTGQYYPPGGIFNIKYLGQCQILKISSIYKEIKQLTVHSLQMHTFYTKYSFHKLAQALDFPFKKPPCAACGKSIRCLRMQFRTASTRAMNYKSKEEIITTRYALNSKIHESIGI